MDTQESERDVAMTIAPKSMTKLVAFKIVN